MEIQFPYIWSSTLDSSGVFTAYLSILADYIPQATSSVIFEMERISTEKGNLSIGILYILEKSLN